MAVGIYMCTSGLQKSLWEKDKLHITCNFSFFPTVFLPFLPLTSSLKLLSAISFTLEESKICCLEKD